MHNATKGDLPRCQDRLQNANEKRKCFVYLVHYTIFHDKETSLHSLLRLDFSMKRTPLDLSAVFHREFCFLYINQVLKIVTKLHKVSINLLDWTGNHAL